ncbi:DUF4435 domain-containing protein [Shewanella sp. LC6]|jgi:hypothetical protein|uniref:DUF4435 domain-containing protein n=1 Tax=Shewanella TaxID=22 RepID=UPI0002DD2F43|nr:MULTISPECIES: DUF4435 domain-containing protein [unclassified Shewanella]ASF15531.1 DUF4435 domain-containing protein [Shewanella sp. FDAARGOS_354]QQK61276.1 DUF4435 domain-containing protein [Shewanella sp. LC6]TPE62348.1 DUF4435 domain-containing protein [Shewanella sp. LC2]
MSGNFYEIDEIFNEAVMTGVPAIIVEGMDDILIYNQLSARVPFEVEIYAVENIEGYSEGCEQVITAIRELNNIKNSKYKLDEHILGIIDKDVRDYRNELPALEPILVLEYYSIESYFVSKDVLHNILCLCTKAGKSLINEDLCVKIFKDVEKNLLSLYYFSLEALRASLDSEYKSIFFYSYPTGRLNDVKIQHAILSKIDELDRFAAHLDLSPNLMTLKSISKGKWLVESFSVEILKSINSLNGMCSGGEIITCQFCSTGAFHKCLYKIRDGINNKSIKNLAFSFIGGADFDHIVDRIYKIKNHILMSA